MWNLSCAGTMMQDHSQPRVGIFWLYNGKLVTDSTPLSEAEPYCDFLAHAKGHIDYWTELQERGAIPTHQGAAGESSAARASTEPGATSFNGWILPAAGARYPVARAY